MISYVTYLDRSSVKGIRVGKPACETRTASRTAQQRNCCIAVAGQSSKGPRT